MPPIYLIGPRGSGKTTVGRLVADAIGYAFYDADALLEERAGRTIHEIFAAEGEPGFRDREAAVLVEIATCKDTVVATGGGVVLRPENRALLERGAVAWLTASAETLWQRMQADASTRHRRPDLAQGGRAEVDDLLRVRNPLYQECADLQIDTGALTADAAAQQILAWWRNME